MKQGILIACIFFFTIISCTKKINYEIEKDYFEIKKNGKNKEINGFPIPKGGSILYYKGIPFTGNLNGKGYKNDLSSYNIQVKEGKLNGVYEEFYESKLILKTNYKSGERLGLYEEYYTSGQLKVQTTLDNNKYIGLLKEYHENGQLEWKGYFNKDNIREGLFEQYYENGKLRSKINYINNEKSGLSEEYYANGQLALKTNYINDERFGLHEEYYENGQLKLKTNYKGGKKNGLNQEYFQNGQLKSKGVYWFDNDDGIWKEYYENGKLKYEGTWIKGKAADGVQNVYHENGNFKKIVYYKNNKLRFALNYDTSGNIIWPYYEYYENGKWKLEVSFNDRNGFGWETSYLESGSYNGTKEITFSDFNKSSKYLYKKIKQVNSSLNEFDNKENRIEDTTSYSVKIKEDKNNINIRKKPINGSVVGKVSGNEVYTVTDEFKTEEPLYLLKDRTFLTDIESGDRIEKPSNFKLTNVKDYNSTSYYADVINIDKSVQKVYVKKNLVKLSYNKWLFLKELNGWIYSEFCTEIK